MRHIFRWSIVATASVVLAGGCMLPAYRFPAGYSSTYFRHLYVLDPRATPHRVPEVADETIIVIPPPTERAPSRAPRPDEQSAVPEPLQPHIERPATPDKPATVPSPPEPLPDDVEGRPAIDATNEHPSPQHEAIPRSLPNTAISIPVIRS